MVILRHSLAHRTRRAIALSQRVGEGWGEGNLRHEDILAINLVIQFPVNQFTVVIGQTGMLEKRSQLYALQGNVRCQKIQITNSLGRDEPFSRNRECSIIHRKKWSSHTYCYLGKS